ncbi:hypothetical protein WR25_21784 [Diploscapter pachys]|uniref:Uncharacterized protein n=1 Tax=Diploscapter pachys TaxID=2018661 RepID=A0A2A2M4J0_9BILA|nr:hypothetical protein WR25_21784 [Diploscapter pachys]
MVRLKASRSWLSDWPDSNGRTLSSALNSIWKYLEISAHHCDQRLAPSPSAVRAPMASAWLSNSGDWALSCWTSSRCAASLRNRPVRSGCWVLDSVARLRANCSRAAKAPGSLCSRRISSAPSTNALALVMSCNAERRKVASRSKCSASARRHSLRLSPSTVSRRWLRRCWSPCSCATRRRRSSSSLAAGRLASWALSCCSRCCSASAR